RLRLRHSRRPGWTMVKKTAAFRQRRAADTARWRERLHRGAAVYPVEVDGTTFDLMERFGGLKDSKTGDRQAIATALGKFLRRALEFPIHPHMLRHGCGYALANAGHDTRALQAWLGHKNIQHTVRYTELAPDRFKDFWRDNGR